MLVRVMPNYTRRQSYLYIIVSTPVGIVGNCTSRYCTWCRMAVFTVTGLQVLYIFRSIPRVGGCVCVKRVPMDDSPDEEKERLLADVPHAAEWPDAPGDESEWRDDLSENSSSAEDRMDGENATHANAVERIDLMFIALGCTCFAVSDINYHMLPSFLPRHLVQRGVSEAGVGLVMASPAVAMLMAVLTLPALRSFSRLNLVLAGLLINSAGSLCLSLINHLPSGQPVLLFSLVIMLAKGFAVGTFEVVMRGLLLSSSPPSTVAAVVGWLAAARNVGGLIGPVAGGVLFQAGGLAIPALLGAGLTVPLAVALRCKQAGAAMREKGVINSSNWPRDEPSGRSPVRAAAVRTASVRVMLRMRTVLVALALIFLAVVNIDMIGVSLPLYFSEPSANGGPFALAASEVGAITSARYVVATLAAFLHGRINRELGDELEACAGATLMTVSLLVMGGQGPPLAFLPLRLETTVAATCIFAIAFELTLLPNTTMMLSSARRHGLDIKSASDAIASLDQATGTTAAVTGRLLGGALIRPLGYRNEFASFAVLPLLVLPVLLVQRRQLRRLLREEQGQQQQQQQQQQQYIEQLHWQQSQYPYDGKAA